MAEKVTGSELRPELEKIAKDLGLENASRYQNKVHVTEAINKVVDGANPADVDAEYYSAPQTPADETEQEEADPRQHEATTEGKKQGKPVVASDAADKEQKKNIYSLNGGHPRAFDETGNPIFDRSQV